MIGSVAFDIWVLGVVHWVVLQLRMKQTRVAYWAGCSNTMRMVLRRRLVCSVQDTASNPRVFFHSARRDPHTMILRQSGVQAAEHQSYSTIQAFSALVLPRVGT